MPIASRIAPRYISGMEPAEITEIGERLYGAGWQTKMADALGVHVTTVWRWLAGKSVMPRWRVEAVRKLGAA